ncbi:LrgB family protein [Thalassotalea fusca]
MNNILLPVIYIGLTVFIYQLFAQLQNKSKKIWLNPMLLAIAVIIPLLLTFAVSYKEFATHTRLLSQLLEPAVVALGFPLYQHLPTIRKHWLPICVTLLVATILAITLSYFVTIYLVGESKVAVSLALKSITTPIGLALTAEFNGNQAITAIAIIIAGMVGAILGLKWLSFLNIHSIKAQGLAIGAASHALGTATISQVSFQHAAYSSVALIVSAIFTAFISPIIFPLMLSLAS